ncbi:MAG: DUF4199 domain-containing protein [Salibacteraceae bacterium]
MLKKPLNVALLAVALSAAVKLFVFQSGNPDISLVPTYSYFLWLLLAIAGRTWAAKQVLPDGPYRYYAVAGMQVAAIYAVLIALFTYTYYAAIDVDFFANKTTENIRLLEESGATPKNIKQFKKNAATIYDPFLHSTITLFGFLMIGVVYSLVIGGLIRKMPR